MKTLLIIIISVGALLVVCAAIGQKIAKYNQNQDEILEKKLNENDL